MPEIRKILAQDLKTCAKELKIGDKILLSGIVYNVDNIHSHTIKTILMFNPITIIANGFRNSMVYHKWFWETPEQMRNYLILTAIMFVLAMWSYKKLNKEIPDVL